VIQRLSGHARRAVELRSARRRAAERGWWAGLRSRILPRPCGHVTGPHAGNLPFVWFGRFAIVKQLVLERSRTTRALDTIAPAVGICSLRGAGCSVPANRHELREPRRLSGESGSLLRGTGVRSNFQHADFNGQNRTGTWRTAR
jgi:hypothetical protein